MKELLPLISVSIISFFIGVLVRAFHNYRTSSPDIQTVYVVYQLQIWDQPTQPVGWFMNPKEAEKYASENPGTHGSTSTVEPRKIFRFGKYGMESTDGKRVRVQGWK